MAARAASSTASRWPGSAARREEGAAAPLPQAAAARGEVRGGEEDIKRWGKRAWVEEDGARRSGLAGFTPRAAAAAGGAQGDMGRAAKNLSGKRSGFPFSFLFFLAAGCDCFGLAAGRGFCCRKIVARATSPVY